MNTPLLKGAAGVFSAAIALFPISGALAADIFWDNPGAGLFTNETNWDTDTVPTETDNAYIMNGGTTQIQTSDIVAVSRLLIEDGTVTQTGGYHLHGAFRQLRSPGAYESGVLPE